MVQVERFLVSNSDDLVRQTLKHMQDCTRYTDASKQAVVNRIQEIQARKITRGKNKGLLRKHDQDELHFLTKVLKVPMDRQEESWNHMVRAIIGLGRNGRLSDEDDRAS